MSMPSEEFGRELTSSQPALLAYILSLRPDQDSAWDILQETNLVLWRKAAQFESGSDFLAWATQVARFRVMSFNRDQRRDRHIYDDALIEQLSEPAERRVAQTGVRGRFLEECMGELTERSRELILERYSDGGSITDMAAARDQSPNTISVALSRTRRTLTECVKEKLAAAKTS